MKRQKTGSAIALLLAATAATAGIARAETADALANYGLTDPAMGKTGTVQVSATAVISQNMRLEFVTPMNLRSSGEPGEPETLRLIAAGKASGQPGAVRSNPPLSAAVSVQGLPNQTFAVSIGRITPGANGQGRPVIATFAHNAGQTPHIGPAGDTEFVIAASLRMARNSAHRGYSGTLDVIVSHN